MVEDPQVGRLRQFFRINIPINFLIVALMFALWDVFRFWPLAVVSVLVGGNIALLFWSRSQLDKGRVEPAALGIAAGVIVLVLSGMYLSGGVVLPILGVLTLWPIMIALPYLGKKSLLRLMFISTAAALFLGLMSLAGDRVGSSSAVPSWVWLTVDALCLPLFVGFICMFVWHYSSHLGEALSKLRTANAALQDSERQLEQKVAERTQELARKNQELMELDDMKTRFVSNASHELRSPLTSIRAFSEILADDPTLSESQAEFVNIINSESERLSRVASDLLDLSRMESGRYEYQPKAVDLRAELTRLFESQRPVAEQKGIGLELDIPAELPAVRADADGLRRVLLNLLDNALKFTERGRVVLTAEAVGDHVQIAISDTGPGISPADQVHVFDPFYQAGNALTEKPSGAGLGLAICREILAQHGSELRLESTPGRGSRFSFEADIASP